MKRLLGLLLVLLAAGALTTTLIGSGTPLPPGAESRSSLPAGLPDGAVEIVAAYPFVVDQPFVHEWRAEKPLVGAGYLLVLKVDPERARPRQTYEPVLYVGEQTAERCYGSEDGGLMVVLAPAALDASGGVALDLDTAPIWFGSLELPERVDATRITQELALAHQNGIGPAARSHNAPATASAQDAIHVRTRRELEDYIDDLSARFSVR